MKIYIAMVFVSLVVILFAGSGCMKNYHQDASCGIECQYCPPPPLPFTTYGDRACHSRPVEKFLPEPTTTIGPVIDPTELPESGQREN